MIVVLLSLSLIAVAIISVATAIVMTHFILKGLEVLISHVISPYQKRDSNECQRHNNNKEANREDISVCPYSIRRYDLYEAIRNRINEMSENQRRQQCPDQEPQTNKNKEHRYINGCLPRWTPPPLPFPVKHILTIVNKLQRRVNQSGKEPWQTLSCAGQTLCHQHRQTLTSPPTQAATPPFDWQSEGSGFESHEL